ncbi:MAG: hypothetical protein ACE5MK_06630 [Acidobacteriota bacterium]
MTVFRYLVGSLILALFAGAAYFLYLSQPAVCEVCQRPMHQATFYRIHLRAGEIEDVCCPRCGLHFQQGRDDIVSTEVGDFATGERFEASQAYYVENSSVHLCCSQDFVQKDRSGRQYSLAWDRCLPSLVAFRSREDAEEFQRQNGGVIKTYDALLVDNF